MKFISELKIDLLQIRKNIIEFRKQISSNQKLCAVVKADAYGLGAKNICLAIDDLVDFFAVSSADEFFEIKKKTKKQIIILDPIYENITKLAKSSCNFCVSNFDYFKMIIDKSKSQPNVEFKIFVAINTGMNRFGFREYKDIEKVFKIVEKTQNVSIFGVFSHFCCGNDEIFAKTQSDKLLNIKDKLSKKFDLFNVCFSISNTAGFNFGKQFDMFRIGIGLFLNKNYSCFSLESKIIEIQQVFAGETVGYGRLFLAGKNIKVAVCQIGYADGIMRKLAGVGYVLICGKYSKILAVCMDSIIVDITNIDCKIGDTVTIIGKNGDKQIFVCDVAGWCDTIEYEIMTRLSKRIKRVYFVGETYANNNRKISCKETCCS